MRNEPGWSPARGFPTTKVGIWRRGNATSSPIDKKTIEKLPLAGIRVLDMTRVLAGVGRHMIEEHCKT